MKKEKLLKKIMSGMKNTNFNDMVKLVEAYGFRLDRINGSHLGSGQVKTVLIPDLGWIGLMEVITYSFIQKSMN